MDDLEDLKEADNKLSEEEEFTLSVSSGHQALYYRHSDSNKNRDN